MFWLVKMDPNMNNYLTVLSAVSLREQLDNFRWVLVCFFFFLFADRTSKRNKLLIYILSQDCANQQSKRART